MTMAVSLDTRDTATITDVVESLHHLDRTFSTHKQESRVSAIGRGELGRDDAGATGSSIRTS
jgi:hypothetical protein